MEEGGEEEEEEEEEEVEYRTLNFAGSRSMLLGQKAAGSYQ